MAMLSERVWWVRQVLEDEGVLGVVDVGECQLDVFPFDTDLLSLELDNSFKVGGGPHTPLSPMGSRLTVGSLRFSWRHGVQEMFIEDDSTALTTVAKSLLKLQSETTTACACSTSPWGADGRVRRGCVL